MKLKSLKPSEKNPRYLKDDKFKILLNKILCYPNLLRENKIAYNSLSKNVVLSGNMRLRTLIYIASKIPKNELLEYIKTAQNALGIDNELLLNNSLAIFNELQETKEIPSEWLKDLAYLSDEEKDAFVIIDNTHEGLWDFEILANEWEIDNVEWNIPLGFEDEDETQSDNTKNSEAKEDDFEGEVSTEPPLTKLGDLYEIGVHRLLCGDSTDRETVEKLMNGEKADMVFTDPPYNAAFNGRSGKHDIIMNDDLSEKDFDGFISKFAKCLNLFSGKENYVCSDWRMYLKVGKYFEHNQLIVWNKDIPCMGKGYRNKHEFIMYKGDFNSTTEVNVWDEVAIQSGASKDDSGKGWFQGGNIQLRIHPTQKPITIPSRAIKNSSKIKNIILDFFLGSGSTMVAAHQLNRKCYGLELDCKYADVIIKRMLNLDNNLTVKRNGVDVTHEYAKQGEI